ncbi:MAG: GNAT family N-acetyltransferase, partial [Ktedonobacteraceae bacterium]|nr:GNAT family N-acetyltransferase [Ktedonobacteraceae bacterium]
NALSYSLEQLAEMHNLSFSGYFVPADMTAAQVADFWRANQIDATRCVVMHDASGAYVGMARMGTRGTRGWCGGFGIVPAFRGTGTSKLLAAEMVHVARESGLNLLQLEVLTQNVRAIKLYESVGFMITRRLFGLEITTSTLPANTASSLTIERVPLETLPYFYPQSYVRPCWSLELPSVLTVPCEVYVANGPDSRMNVFVALRLADKVRVQAMLQSQLTDEEFAATLRAVARDATTLQIFNEPEDSPLLQRYVKLGFTEFFSQYEMLLHF